MVSAFNESLTTILLRDLDKLEQEILLFPDEASIWKIRGSIKNPAGNLCLHLCGNLQYYIGTVLGNSGYVRNRDLEFSERNVPRKKLVKEIAGAREAIQLTFPGLKEEHLIAQYPVDVFGKPMSTLYFLVHLSAHFGYHLGQVNYHRRLVSGD